MTLSVSAAFSLGKIDSYLGHVLFLLFDRGYADNGLMIGRYQDRIYRCLLFFFLVFFFLFLLFCFC
ncbi:hypothetical protein V8C37DRAFT_72195 [Trichoderma ceciliae]